MSNISLLIKRGLLSNLPTTGVATGTPLYTTDTKQLFIADTAGVPQLVTDFTQVATKSALPASDVTGRVFIVVADETQEGKTTLYKYISGAWTQIGGGSVAFTNLTDAPSSYTGEGGKALRVNASENGLEFFDVATQVELDALLTAVNASIAVVQGEVDAVELRATAIEGEISTARGGKTDLNTRFVDVETALGNEITNRSNADTALQAEIDAVESDLVDLIASIGQANGLAPLNAQGVVASQYIDKQYKEVKVVADLNERDALTPADLFEGLSVLVIDATADATVASGSAYYVYDLANTAWVKIAETENLDVVLDWANIQNRPTSTVAQIDDAVAKAHVHANKTELDKVGELDGYATYNNEKLAKKSEVDSAIATINTDIAAVQTYAETHIGTKLVNETAFATGKILMVNATGELEYTDVLDGGTFA